ncbi:uncharacterized protein EAF01_003220 [Botrytis porri]|uniref:Glucose-methanol-choline oxidoreductase N-terminal domain-containing protein n=1 Tax=Botrytis porri TaxID=87229 RepID=A0A4Z1KGS2_9HELO|nr:uncharacterized protein EAF01_003220 [Botrytis porri]KAF7909502.1 hypothetical protein EAF01_003220 [Botrytis porri]TGO84750.1 hypothetical protein BPOR_0469g00010 [Botrytis porri]
MSLQNEDDDTFDVIIVGGGTAGSLLAARLSSTPTFRILVLEAGRNRNSDPKVSTPGLAGSLLGNQNYDWGFRTVSEQGLNGRVILQPRGKLWGGSSAINSHALVYPSSAYHDAWGSLVGAGNSWDWEGIGKYYTRFQTLQAPSEEVRRELEIGDFAMEGENVRKHDESEYEGGIQASYPVTLHPMQKAWTDAIQDLGYSSSKNPVEGGVLGGSTTTNAIDSCKGERSHAGVAFLEPSTKRDNLVVRSNVLVNKIMFGEEKRGGKVVATGVLYSQENGKTVVVHANREVVVCAGTFGSPKLLELSGIGQRERLTTAGIECFCDLRGVGENLQDHLNFGPSVEVLDNIETADVSARDPTITEAAKRLYEAKHIGRLAEGAAYSFSYLPLKAFNSEEEERELSALVNRILLETSSTMSKGLQAQYDIIKRIILDPEEASSTVFMTRKQRYTPSATPAPGNYMTILAMLSYPFSRGSSHITTADASEYPEIKINYLEHPLDAEILSRHIIQIGQMLEQPKLSALLKPNGNTLPSGFPRRAKSVEEVTRYIRQFGATNYHPVGTCAMMSEDLDGVVDENLMVHGTANVRVCDASVIPIEPRGNVLSTVYAVAEKGADILKRDLGV